MVKKANGMLAFVVRVIDRDVWLQLYRALVKPRLEYCVQFLYLLNQSKDVLAPERGQQGLIPGVVDNDLCVLFNNRQGF